MQSFKRILAYFISVFDVLKLFSVVLKTRAEGLRVMATVAARGLRIPEQGGVKKKYSEIEIFVTVSGPSRNKRMCYSVNCLIFQMF